MYYASAMQTDVCTFAAMEKGSYVPSGLAISLSFAPIRARTVIG